MMEIARRSDHAFLRIPSRPGPWDASRSSRFFAKTFIRDLPRVEQEIDGFGLPQKQYRNSPTFRKQRKATFLDGNCALQDVFGRRQFQNRHTGQRRSLPGQRRRFTK
jgi:hypothetical protein